MIVGKYELKEYGPKEHGLKEYGLKEHGLKEHGLKEHGLKEHGLKKYELEGTFKKAFAFLHDQNFTSMEAGKIEIDGDEMFAVLQRYSTRNASSIQFENHTRYIDIQYMVSGSEKILVTDLSNLPSVAIPYDSSKDIAFYHDPCTPAHELMMQPGDFAIFMPDDGHKTQCSVKENTPAAVCKVIVKIKL